MDSSDETVELARRLNFIVVVHKKTAATANQKTCCAHALNRGADVVVMLHPDDRYSPRLVTAMASMIAYGVQLERSRDIVTRNAAEYREWPRPW